MSDLLERGTPAGRRAMATVILGSGITLLDGTVVNIAVKAIGHDLDAGMAELQWVVNGYLLALASLLLLGGALGDRFGHRRVYLTGVAAFGVASAACMLAQTPGQLVGFRVAQGVAAALLTPGSLAILRAGFRRVDRPAVIGTWAGMSGIAAATGPFVGGLLLDHGGWRWIFAINLPLCALVLWLGRTIPESRKEEVGGTIDVVGSVLALLSLVALTCVLTFWPSLSGGLTMVLGAVVVVLWLGFVRRQHQAHPLLPLSLFGSRVFSAANLMTLLVYGVLGAVMFLLVLQLQISLGYTALAAGVATLPVTLALVLLSSRFAVLSARTGPRLPMSVGPLLCAAGVLLLSSVDAGSTYWIGVFPGIVLFALGLAGLVSPLTTAVLAAAPERNAGIASGVNSAVARAGSLVAVAALPGLVGLGGHDYQDPEQLTDGYRIATWTCAALLAAGGVVSWFGLAGTEPRLVGSEANGGEWSDEDEYYVEHDAQVEAEAGAWGGDDEEWETDEEWISEDDLDDAEEERT